MDNLEDLHLLQQFIPDDRQGAVLLTTRRQVTEPVAQALELEVLSENDAILFLLKRTKTLTINQSLEYASDLDIENTRAIAQLLGNLPLALDQAGAYILETQCSFADYLALFKTYQEQLLQRRIAKSIPTDHPHSVVTTFSLNFQQVQQSNYIAAEILCLCAFLAPDAIPEEVLTACASLSGSKLGLIAMDAFQLNQAIEVLRAYSLIKRNPREQTFSIHRLVQAVLQHQQASEERQDWAERAMQAINAAFPHEEYETWTQCEGLLPHALQSARYIEQYQIHSKEAGRLLHETASYLVSRARYREAKALLQKSLSIREQHLGSNDLDVAASLRELGTASRELGEFEEARTYYQRALSIFQKQSGSESLNAAKTSANLATISYHLGNYAEMEQYYQQALPVFEKQPGPKHSTLGALLTNQAEAYREQGRYEAAEQLFLRALFIWEHHDRTHPLFANTLNNLGILYKDRKEYKKAESQYHQARDIWVQNLGPDHPQTAIASYGLAELHQKQKQYPQAEMLYRKILPIWEGSFGSEHPYVCALLDNLAALYKEQAQYEQSENLYKRIIPIIEAKDGYKEKDKAEILYNFAQLQEVQGKNEEAKTMYVRALSIREQVLGVNHPETVETRKRLTALLE